MFELYFKAQDDLVQKYGEHSVVLLMAGGFYEIYGINKHPRNIKNLEEIHEILGMSIYLKNGKKPHSSQNPYGIGFPDYALDEHIGKLINNNFVVAIYDQYDKIVEKNGRKRTIKDRRLTNIYTPSTYIDSSIETNGLLVFNLVEYTSTINNQKLKRAHIVILFASTGKIHMTDIYENIYDKGKTDSELYRIIHTFNPREIIICSSDKSIEKILDIEDKKIYYKTIPSEYSQVSYQNDFLKKIYKDSLVDPLEYLNLEKNANLTPVLLKAIQFAYEQDRAIVLRLEKPIFMEESSQLILSNDTLYQLNIVPSPFGIHSLFDILCKAKTPMGKRYFKHRLLNPSCDAQKLNNSYDMIENLLDSYKEYEEHLKGIDDIEKKYRKMVVKSLQPYELAQLSFTFKSIIGLLKYSHKNFDIKNNIINKFCKFFKEYEELFNFEVMKKSKLNDIQGSFFKKGKNKKLDEIETNIKKKLKVLEEIETKMADFIDPKKKYVWLKYTDLNGYFLRMKTHKFKTLSNDFKIEINEPIKISINKGDFEVINLKTDVKLYTPEIKLLSKEIEEYRKKQKTIVKEEYLNILEAFVQEYGDLFLRIAKITSRIDFVYCGAKIAMENGYKRPKIKEKDMSFLNAKGMRHPIIEKICNDKEYIPNNISIGIGEHYGSVIYGLNMSGKSALLKSIGCNIIMAQAGLFVACSSLEYSPFKTILSKMVIRDNMSKGMSTFMVEMMEVKNMLSRADKNTIILSDELCSSTESTSGHAIVAQTLDMLTKTGAKFIFSTHLHELQKIPIVKDNKNIKIYHFKVHIKDNEIIFDRKLEPGGISELYGLEVARALGLPAEFISGSLKVRDYLTAQNTEFLKTKKSRYNKDVYVHSCEECGKTSDLHTHHQRHQCEADENGLIDGRFNKDFKFNLRILCKECHTKEHLKH